MFQTSHKDGNKPQTKDAEDWNNKIENELDDEIKKFNQTRAANKEGGNDNSQVPSSSRDINDTSKLSVNMIPALDGNSISLP